MRVPQRLQPGFSLIELMITLAVGTILMASLLSVIDGVLEARNESLQKEDTLGDLRFAMRRMVMAATRSDRLLLPLADNPGTGWREHVRQQSHPPEPPEPESEFASAVLALSLGPTLDRDQDGFADADNDRDGRIDEDPPGDLFGSGVSGLPGIDDNGDGKIDDGLPGDDDEDGTENEDPWNGQDDDKDGPVGEDPGKDVNGDGAPGRLAYDDDGDGQIDEGTKADDDEDGREDEDWLDAVVFHLSGQVLIERIPNLDPVDGRDFTEHPIAENVTHFRVERVAGGSGRHDLVSITLELTPGGGRATRLSTTVRVGGDR